MLLSQTAEYALRSMCWMATQEAGFAIRARDLSKATDIPPHYLSKILRRLVIDGLLLSRRGHGGGFSLGRAPNEITFMMILAAVDAAPSCGRCVFGWGECDADHPCPMHGAWIGISGEFVDWAARTTLADLGPLDNTTIAWRAR